MLILATIIPPATSSKIATAKYTWKETLTGQMVITVPKSLKWSQRPRYRSSSWVWLVICGQSPFQSYSITSSGCVVGPGQKLNFAVSKTIWWRKLVKLSKNCFAHLENLRIIQNFFAHLEIFNQVRLLLAHHLLILCLLCLFLNRKKF